MKANPLTTLLSAICFWMAVIPISNLCAADDPLDWVRTAVPAPDAEGWITLFDGRLLHACEPESIRNRMDRIGVGNGELWLDNTSLRFNLDARNVALRAVVKKVSGQNLMLKCREKQNQSYSFWFNGGNHFGIGMFKPQWADITDARAARNFPDYFQMELIAKDSLITLKANDESLKALEDHAIDASGGVGIGTYRGKSLFKKIQVKILDAPPPPLSWSSTEGKTITAEFIRLEGESVVVRKDGKELAIPLAKLSLASRNQARQMAGNAPDEPSTSPSTTPGAGLIKLGKQEDPDHQRKLAESIIAKGGRVDIWRGSGMLTATRLEDLPAGKISLKFIDAQASPFSEDDSNLLNGCDDLTRIRLHRVSLDTFPLESLPNLTFLDILDSRISPSALHGLGSCKNLKELYLNTIKPSLDPRILEIIASCPNIEVLQLPRTGLTGKSLQPLVKMRTIRNLRLDGNAIEEADLVSLSKLPALMDLGLCGIDFSDAKMDFLPSLKTLRVLDLGGAKLPVNTMEKVAAMPSLAVLQLYGSNVSGKSLHPLARQKELRDLLLEQTAVSADDLAGMPEMPRLARLHLNGPMVIVSDAGAKTIASTFPGLTALRVDAKDMTIRGCSELARIKNLKEVSLVRASRLDAEWLTALSKIKGLSKLSLPGSAIKDSDVPNLEPLKNTLQELHLDNARISDASIPSLGKLKSLRIITIIGTDITKDGAESLRNSLRGCAVRY